VCINLTNTEIRDRQGNLVRRKPGVVSYQKTLATVRRRYPESIRTKKEEVLVRLLMKLQKKGHIEYYKNPLNERLIGSLCKLAPEYGQPDAYVTIAHNIAKFGSDSEISGVPQTLPIEMGLSIDRSIGLARELIKMIDMKMFTGNVRLEEGEKMFIREIKTGTGWEVNYHPLLGIPKKDPSKVRPLINQGASQICDGELWLSLNPQIIERYAEMYPLRRWLKLTRNAKCAWGLKGILQGAMQPATSISQRHTFLRPPLRATRRSYGVKRRA